MDTENSIFVISRKPLDPSITSVLLAGTTHPEVVSLGFEHTASSVAVSIVELSIFTSPPAERAVAKSLVVSTLVDLNGC